MNHKKTRRSGKINLGLIFLILVGALIAGVYFLRPEIALLPRLGIHLVLAIVAGVAMFFTLRKPNPYAQGTGDHEDYGKKLRDLYLEKVQIHVPGIPWPVRKEAIPAALFGLILFVVWSVFGPCRAPKVVYPDFSEIISAELGYPTLFVSGDGLVLLAPAVVSSEAEAWAVKMPQKTTTQRMFTLVFQNDFQSAVDMGINATHAVPPGEDVNEIRLALAQAHLLNGQFEESENELRKLLELQPNVPAVQYPLAIALAYQGKWRESEKLFTELKSRASTDEMRRGLEYWAEVFPFLAGECDEKNYVAYGERFDQIRVEYFKQKEALSATSGEVAPEEAEKVRLMARQFVMLSSNLAVLQILNGEERSALSSAEAAELLAKSLPERTRKVYALTTSNSKALAMVGLGRRPMKDSKFEFAQPTTREQKTDAEGGFRSFADLLTKGELPETFFQQAFQACDALEFGPEHPLRYVLKASRMGACLQNEFGTSDCPTVAEFQKRFSNDLLPMQKLHSQWIRDGIAISRPPVWAIAVESLLMRYYSVVEGSAPNAEEAYNAGMELADTFLKKNSLVSLAECTRYVELRIASRFAVGEKLGSLEQTRELQKKTLSAASKTLPKSHRLIARGYLSSARLSLLNKQKKSSQKALDAARDVLKLRDLPETHVLRISVLEVETLLAAVAAPSDSQAIWDVYTAPMAQLDVLYGENSLCAAFWLRDLGAVLTLRGKKSVADTPIRRALAIYSTIYGEKGMQHQYLTGMRSLLPEGK